MDNLYDKIDQYLQGILQGEELTAFEQELQTDQQLADAVNQQRKAIQFLEIVNHSKLKSELQNIHQSVVGKQTPIEIQIP